MTLRACPPSSPRKRDSINRLLRSFLALQGVPLSGNPELDLPVEWTSLLPELRAYRLRPLAYWLIRALGVRPPAAAAEELRSAFYSAVVRHDRLRATLAEIANAFSRSGIPLLLLKGLSLAERLYPDPACRPMEDIDVLVRPQHRPSATRLLQSLGYSDTSFGIEDYRNPETGIVVDLHAELLNTTRLPARRMAWDPRLDIWWNRARPTGADLPAYSLDPADELVYLCHHAWLHHGLRRPLGLLDVCLLFSKVESQQENWALWRRDDLEATRRGLWYTLASCENRFGLLIPRASLLRLRPPDAGPLERTIHRAAARGWLPTKARYIYLWFAMPRKGRRALIRQILSATRKVIWGESGARIEP